MNGKLEEHLRNIGDLIRIDDQIVTYRWVSKSLKVHSNTAKQLLYSFTQKPDLKEQLLITYIVAGETKGGEGLTFQLVSGDALEDTKKKFTKVSSVHVYSVQKGKIVSGADIYNADKTYNITSDDRKYCSIQPADDITRREIQVPSARIDPTPSTISKKSAIPESTKTNDKTSKPSVASGKDEAQEDVKRRTSPRKASPKKSELKKPSAPSKSGGIGALFMKQAAKKKDDTAKDKEDKPSDKKEKGNSIPEKKENDEVKKVNGTEKDSDKPSTKAGGKSKNKRKKPSNSKDSAAKRRKRIQVASDSESSGESESDGDQRYPSPEPEPEAPTVIESEDEEIIPSTPVEKGRKRVRKQVDKTYTDEEGYIITKKEFVFESCSDDEDSEPAKKKSDLEEPIRKPEEKPANEAPKEVGKKKDPKKSEDGKKTETTSKKPGRPPAKSKASGGSSPKKQSSIMKFFKAK